MKKALLIILPIIIFISSGYLRLRGIDWDEGTLLHPDERFLIMVQGAVEWPSSISEYFNTAVSPLNPNNRNFGFYVYGTLPLILVKSIMTVLESLKIPYQPHLLGRFLSTTLDLGNMILVAGMGWILFGYIPALLAMALIGFSAFHIQQSHFGTVDVSLTFFTTLALFIAVVIQWLPMDRKRRFLEITIFSALFGFATGCAAASKINAVLVAVLLPIAVYTSGARWRDLIITSIVAAFTTILTFRIFQPYAFAGPGFFNLSFNPKWLANLAEIRRLSQISLGFPPAVQWMDRGHLFGVRNLIFWGLGLPFGMFSIAALSVGILGAIKNKAFRRKLSLPAVWIVICILFFSLATQNPSMRYLLPAYGPIFIISASFVVYLLRWCSRSVVTGIAIWTVVPSFLLLSFLWGLAFAGIYNRPNSRVQASDWILDNLSFGAAFSGVSSDAARVLPVPISDNATIPANGSFTMRFRPTTKFIANYFKIFSATSSEKNGAANNINLEARINSNSLDCLLTGGPMVSLPANGGSHQAPVQCIFVPDTEYQITIHNKGQQVVSLHKPIVASETSWDDGLPLRRRNLDPYGGLLKGGVNFELYAPEPDTKPAKIAQGLADSTYLFISSNRQWGSIGRLPKDFPTAHKLYLGLADCHGKTDVTKCYNDLTAQPRPGRLGYRLVKTFTSYPSIFGWEFNTQYAEEALSVYDHQKVLIFVKEKNLSIEELEAALR